MNEIKNLLLKRKKFLAKIDSAVKSVVKERSSLLGKNIKKYRKENAYTQSELAEMMNMSRTQITNIEIGNSSTTIETVILLAEIFSTTPNLLLGYNEKAD